MPAYDVLRALNMMLQSDEAKERTRVQEALAGMELAQRGEEGRLDRALKYEQLTGDLGFRREKLESEEDRAFTSFLLKKEDQALRRAEIEQRDRQLDTADKAQFLQELKIYQEQAARSLHEDASLVFDKYIAPLANSAFYVSEGEWDFKEKNRLKLENMLAGDGVSQKKAREMADLMTAAYSHSKSSKENPIDVVSIVGFVDIMRDNLTLIEKTAKDGKKYTTFANPNFVAKMSAIGMLPGMDNQKAMIRTSGLFADIAGVANTEEELYREISEMSEKDYEFERDKAGRSKIFLGHPDRRPDEILSETEEMSMASRSEAALASTYESDIVSLKKLMVRTPNDDYYSDISEALSGNQSLFGIGGYSADTGFDLVGGTPKFDFSIDPDYGSGKSGVKSQKVKQWNNLRDAIEENERGILDAQFKVMTMESLKKRGVSGFVDNDLLKTKRDLELLRVADIAYKHKAEDVKDELKVLTDMIVKEQHYNWNTGQSLPRFR